MYLKTSRPWEQSPNGYLFDDPANPGTGNPAGGTGDPAKPAAAATTGDPNPASGGEPAKKDTAAPAGQFTYKEDRGKWIPPHRLTEESTKRQRLEAELETSRRQLQALTGATPPTAQTQEADEVRAAFKQMFPHLAKFDDKMVDRLIRISEQSEQFEQTQTHYWQQHVSRSLKSLSDSYAKEHGLEKLSERQQRRMAAAFSAELNADAAKAQRDGEESEMVRRYESGDTALFEEFVKEWVEDFSEPARRQKTAAEVARVGARVPSGRGTQNVATNSKPKIDFTNEQATEDAMVEAFKAHGGSFRR